MNLIKKILNLFTKNIYTFFFLIIFLIILIYSISIILDIKSINPFLYFEF